MPPAAELRTHPDYRALCAGCRLAAAPGTAPFLVLSDWLMDRDVPDTDPEVVALRGVRFLARVPLRSCRFGSPRYQRENPDLADVSPADWLAGMDPYAAAGDPQEYRWAVAVSVTSPVRRWHPNDSWRQPVLVPVTDWDWVCGEVEAAIAARLRRPWTDDRHAADPLPELTGRPAAAYRQLLVDSIAAFRRRCNPEYDGIDPPAPGLPAAWGGRAVVNPARLVYEV